MACHGCKGELITPDPAQRLCPECRASLYEGLAAKIDRTYDPARPQTWERCSAVLARLWGRLWEHDLTGQHRR